MDNKRVANPIPFLLSMVRSNSLFVFVLEYREDGTCSTSVGLNVAQVYTFFCPCIIS